MAQHWHGTALLLSVPLEVRDEVNLLQLPHP